MALDFGRPGMPTVFGLWGMGYQFKGAGRCVGRFQALVMGYQCDATLTLCFTMEFHGLKKTALLTFDALNKSKTQVFM